MTLKKSSDGGSVVKASCQTDFREFEKGIAVLVSVYFALSTRRHAAEPTSQRTWEINWWQTVLKDSLSWMEKGDEKEDFSRSMSQRNCGVSEWQTCLKGEGEGGGVNQLHTCKRSLISMYISAQLYVTIMYYLCVLYICMHVYTYLRTCTARTYQSKQPVKFFCPSPPPPTPHPLPKNLRCRKPTTARINLKESKTQNKISKYADKCKQKSSQLIFSLLILLTLLLLVVVEDVIRIARHRWFGFHASQWFRLQHRFRLEKINKYNINTRTHTNAYKYVCM